MIWNFHGKFQHFYNNTRILHFLLLQGGNSKIDTDLGMLSVFFWILIKALKLSSILEDFFFFKSLCFYKVLRSMVLFCYSTHSQRDLEFSSLIPLFSLDEFILPK